MAYARVSTLLNQNPENQLISMRRFASARGFNLVQEYVDKGVSGAKESRPALDQLAKDAMHGKFKIVLVAGIDRLARDTRHLLNLLHQLNSYGVSVISLRESLDFTTPMGQAALTILGAIAQLERELIRERIRTALAAKKLAAQSKGQSWKCGRPSVITKELVQQVLGMKDAGMSIRSMERALQKRISRTSIEKILKTSLSVNHA